MSAYFFQTHNSLFYCLKNEVHASVREAKFISCPISGEKKRLKFRFRCTKVRKIRVNTPKTKILRSSGAIDHHAPSPGTTSSLTSLLGHASRARVKYNRTAPSDWLLRTSLFRCFVLSAEISSNWTRRIWSFFAKDARFFFFFFPRIRRFFTLFLCIRKVLVPPGPSYGHKMNDGHGVFPLEQPRAGLFRGTKNAVKLFFTEFFLFFYLNLYLTRNCKRQLCKNH